jgi:hypothetical protein
MTESDEQGHAKGYRGTTGRISGRGAQGEPLRSRSRPPARQILSGADIRQPLRSPGSYPAPTTVLTQPQTLYAAALGILLVLGLLLWLIFGMGVASIIFFLLALGLLGGWLAF